MKWQYDLGRVEVRKRTRLPHWEIEHGAQFITFNEADAVPRHIRESIELEADEELQKLRGIPNIDPEMIREVVSRARRRISRVLDEGHGRCSMLDPRVAAIVEDSIRYLDGRTYDLLTWSVMPNHVHLVVGTTGTRMEDYLEQLKGFTSRSINKLLGRRGKFWSDGYYDTAIRDTRQLESTIRYVLNNPSAAGLLEWRFAGSRPEKIARYL